MIKSLYSFGGISIPQLAAQISIPTKARSNLIRLDDGVLDTNGARLHVTASTISASFNAQPDTLGSLGNLTELANLRRMLGRGERVLVGRTWDGELWGTYAKMTSFTHETSADMLNWQPVRIEWQRTYSYWMPTEDMGVVLDNNALDGTLSLDGNTEHIELTTTSTDFTISDTGNVRFVHGRVTVIPQSGGSLDNLGIYNNANDLMWSWEGSLTDTDTLTIDFLTRTVTLNFVNSAYYNANGDITVTLQPTRADWMWLEEESDNDITVTCDSITGTIDFYWHWMQHYW